MTIHVNKPDEGANRDNDNPKCGAQGKTSNSW